MRFYKTFALIVALGAAFAIKANAADLPQPLSGGTIDVRIQVLEGPDSLGTKSVATRRLLTGEIVGCFDVTVPGQILTGTTNVIANDQATVLLEGIAFSEAGCLGVASLPSADTYSVSFGIPLAPVLMQP